MTMTERVARALDAEAWSPDTAADCSYPAAARRLDNRQQISLANARAAIQAMRDIDEETLEEMCGWPSGLNAGEHAKWIYQRAIDAALEEPLK